MLEMEVMSKAGVESVGTEMIQKQFVCQVEQAVKKEVAGSIKSMVSRLEIEEEEKVGTFVFGKGSSCDDSLNC